MKKNQYGIKGKWMGEWVEVDGVVKTFDTAAEALAWADDNDYDLDEIEVTEVD